MKDDIAEGQGHDTLETAHALAILNRNRIPWPLSKAKKNRETHIQKIFRKKRRTFLRGCTVQREEIKIQKLF